MIEIKSNITEFCDGVIKQLSAMDISKMTRLQASTLMAQMRRRIHVDGLAADGRPIGTYSRGYLRYVRPKYGRTEGSKVVLSLTRTMENAMVLYPLENGTGIGYATAEQLQKARWCEETYKRKIFSPTTEERNTCIQIGKNYINKHLNGANY